MGTLKLDVQARWREGLLVVLVYALTMFVACSYGRPEPMPESEVSHPTHWATGGPGWRVMDVRETADSAGLAFIYAVAEEVGECLGRDIDLEGWRFFGFNVLMHQKVLRPGAWIWKRAHGVARPVEKWLYVEAENSRRSADSVMGTLKHELVHVGMLGEEPDHPKVDALIGKCAGMHKGQGKYRRAWERSQQ